MPDRWSLSTLSTPPSHTDDGVTVEVVQCQHCGKRIHVSGVPHPLRYAEHAGDAQSPRRFFIFGGAWLVHSCTINEDPIPDPMNTRRPI